MIKRKKCSASQDSSFPGVRGQLMLFLCSITILTLVLVWALITYGLQPMYNRHIRTKLTKEATAIVGMIDSADGPISSRDLGPLVLLNDEFWNELNEAISNGTIDVDGCCIDISDSTCRNVQYLEGLYPCILHKSMVSFGSHAIYSKDTPTVVRLRQTLFSQGSLYEIAEEGSTRQMMVGVRSQDGNYGVIVSSSLTQIETAAEVMSSMLIPLALGLIILNILLAAVFSKWFTDPLRKMSDGAREIAAGNYDVRVPAERRDELGVLGREFNHMAQEVKTSAQLERDILANVSHDLRTPLTLIKGYAETVRDLTGDNPEKRSEQCNIIVDETDRLSALVNSVMELSKVSSGTEKPEPVDFDMSQLCFEVAGRYDALCEQNGWTLRLEADRECPVRADPAMMERVLHNLLGNATHHIGPDGVIVLRAIPLKTGCRVEVEDHGPGIPPEDLPHIFDRYYRSRKDAGKSGTGLGLSITKAILQQHGFAYGVNSTVGRGSVFWFEMKSPESSD